MGSTPSTYVLALEKVGPDSYIGWTRRGSYVIGVSGRDGKWIATFHRQGAPSGQYQTLGRFEALREAKSAVQAHAQTARRTGRP